MTFDKSPDCQLGLKSISPDLENLDYFDEELEAEEYMTEKLEKRATLTPVPMDPSPINKSFQERVAVDNKLTSCDSLSKEKAEDQLGSEEQSPKNADKPKAPETQNYPYYPPPMHYPPHYPPYYHHQYPPHPYAYGYPPRGYPYPYPPYPDPYYNDRQGGWGHQVDPNSKAQSEQNQAGVQTKPHPQTQEPKKLQKSEQEVAQDLGPEDAENQNQVRKANKPEPTGQNLEQQGQTQSNEYQNPNEQPPMHQYPP